MPNKEENWEETKQHAIMIMQRRQVQTASAARAGCLEESSAVFGLPLTFSSFLGKAARRL
jgi:hypothetical protein